MSSTNYLKTVYPEATFSLMHTNTEYGFVIYQMLDSKSGTQLLFTEGCNQHQQATVGEENLPLNRIELYFYLPEYVSLEEQKWPAEWLNKIAQVPQKNDTWFGYGDTIPAGNPAMNICPDTEMNHFILSAPIALAEQLNDSTDFAFLAVIPLFEAEFDYKMRNSHTVLFNRFVKKNMSEKVDLYRSSICRKRILGLI